MKITTAKKVMILLLCVMLIACWMPAVSAHAADNDADVQEIVSKMTLQQKITQCLMMDFRCWNDAKGEKYDMTVLNDDVADIIADYQFGAVILFANNIKKTEETLQLTKDLQRAAVRSDGLPLLIATDQEGGIVYRLGSGTALPGNMALGATGDPANAKTAGQIISRELESVGINTALAPVLDVNSNANNTVIGLRSFGDNVDLVGTYGGAFISGLGEKNIIGCAKHYPGHGDTATDSHYGLPVVDKSKAELQKVEFKPFQAAINDGIDMIMTAHILYPQIDKTTILSDKTGQQESRPATLSHVFLTDIVRGEMKFNGVVVTDAMNMQGITDHFTEEQSTLEALKAGADLICMPVTGVYDKTELRPRLDAIVSHIESAVESGDLSMQRLDEAVTRILALKQKKQILAYDEANYTAERALATVGSAENRELERVISAKAVTIIRNQDNILPYQAGHDTKILMLCPYDNERAQMVMGLNRAKKAGKVSEDAQVRVYRYSDADLEIQGMIKDDLDWADLVVINSEISRPDRMDYSHWLSAAPKKYTEYCRQNGKKSVIMSVDKPYDVQLYPDADAVLAVYGCKGSSVDITEALIGGVTTDDAAYGPNIIAGVEVLLGVFNAQGKLPVNIPVFDSVTGKYTDEIRYARGYGLTYGENVPMQASIRSVKAGKKKFTVKAATDASAIGGTKYQVSYKVKGTSKWHYKKSATRTITVTKLKKGKKYVIKLRAINTAGSKITCGKWSRTKTSNKIR